MKRRKSSAAKPQFPKPREEFAGELTPQIWPGPVTRAHPGRFAPAKRARQAENAPASEDNGIWTRDGV